MAIHRLNAATLKKLRPGKYEDGGGLRFVVSKRLARKWVYRFTVAGKRREMGLGSYPAVTLAEARRKAIEYRKQVSEDRNPIQERRQEAVRIPTFTGCAARYIRAHRRGWRNRKHAKQWVSTLKTYARPIVGKKTVDNITTEDVLKILNPIWNDKTETAKRVQGRMENIIDFATAHGYRETANPARWRGHLDKLLPKPSRVARVQHHPAMPYEQVPALIHKLRESDSISALALQLLILTATRTSEVLKAQWVEIDLEETVWIIPPERMKSGREHRVPLSAAAVSILGELPRIAGTPFLFPGTKLGKPLSNMALLQLMRRMGYGGEGDLGDYVPHGFRSSFRDWSGEISSYPRDVAEMALAHVIENKVEAAYRRGDLFAKRRQMMDDWAGYLVGHSTNL